MIEFKTNLQKRVGTAVIGAALLLLLITAGGRLGTAFLAAAISLGMLAEFVAMTFTLSDKEEKRWVLLGSSWLLSFVNFWVPRGEYELLMLVFIGVFIYFLFTADRHEGLALQEHFRELMYSVFGMLYLGFLPLYLVLIRDAPHGAHWLISFLLIIWGGDTGAYFAGLKYGRRKLYPHISPNKTIEGALGGIATGWVVQLLYKLVFFHSMPWLAVLLVPLLIGALAPVGDLCESFLKRAFKAKDSGSILPGHGGFLDRFDGLIFSLPLMYGLVKLFS